MPFGNWRDQAAGLYNTVADAFNEQVEPPYDYPSMNKVQSQPQVAGQIDMPVSITLNGSGDGIASIGPARVREWWSNVVVSVSAVYVSSEAQVNLYVGSTVVSSTFLGTTPNGSHGATATLPNPIPAGYQIWAVWSGGDADVQATLRVQGTYTIGKPR